MTVDTGHAQSDTRRVLLLSAPAGRAHERRAEALRAAGAAWFPDWEFQHADVLSIMSPAVSRAYAWAHRMLTTHAAGLHASVYRHVDGMYARPDGARATSLARVSGGLARLARCIHACQPRAIVTTHSLATEFACEAAARCRPAVPVWAVPTEFWFQHFEYQPGVSGYCAPSDEVAWGLERCGVLSQEVHLTGPPVSPAFPHAGTRTQCLHSLGLPADAPIVTVMAGGQGVDRLDRTTAALLDNIANCHVLAVPGTNDRLRRRLLRMAQRASQRMTVTPADARIERVFGCTDVLVSKAGASTLSEALVCGVPTVLFNVKRGCEDGNMAYLVERGAAWYAAHLHALVYRVTRLLNDEECRALMRARARALGRPDAARTILELVLRTPAGRSSARTPA